MIMPMPTGRPLAMLLALVVAVAAPTAAAAQDQLDLQTATAEEGFTLAVELARKSVTTTQPDKDVLVELRAAYARDPALLIQSSAVVAEFFATVAAANDYWRDQQ
jgi:hypothetical protein